MAPKAFWLLLLLPALLLAQDEPPVEPDTQGEGALNANRKQFAMFLEETYWES